MERLPRFAKIIRQTTVCQLSERNRAFGTFSYISTMHSLKMLNLVFLSSLAEANVVVSKGRHYGPS